MTKFGGLLKSTSALAVVAAAGLFMGGMTPSKAADLGGDCCADLEERVAELEATTVRKGNRVMSVTLSGRVDEALLWFDEGTGGDQDVYVVDRGSRIRIEGSGNIRPGLKMGYRVQLSTKMNGDAGKVTGNKETIVIDPVTLLPVTVITEGYNLGGGVDIGDVYWYVEHESLGRLTVGNTSGAADNVGFVNLPGSIFDGPDTHGAGLGIVGNFSTVGADFGQMVRWDSPTFANALGFSASWGQDDVWSVAAVYGQEFNGLRIAATVAYEVDDNLANIGPGNDLQKTRVSGSIFHIPSGLYLSANWGSQQLGSGLDAGEHVYVHGGIAKDFSGIGQTDFYGDWGQSRKFGHDTDMWGLGLEQTINAVSSTAYINYRNYSDANGVLPDTSLVIGGVRVNF